MGRMVASAQRRGRNFNSRSAFCIVAAIVVGYLTLLPVAATLYASFRSNFLGVGPSAWTLDHYTSIFKSPGFSELVSTSLIFAVSVGLVSVVLGFTLAWLYVRTNTPGKRFALIASLVPLIIPGILNTVAWALLLAPGTGPVNAALHGLGLPGINVYSMHGMVFIQATHVAPIAFLMGVASLSSMDASLEEAAAASGAKALVVFRTITFPLIRPAILGATFLMIVQTISSFEVPQLIGGPAHKRVFATQIFTSLRTFPPDYGSVAVIGVLVLVLATIGLYAARRLGVSGSQETITGKGFKPAVTDLGRWRWVGPVIIMVFFTITAVMPLGILLWASLLPTYRPLDLDSIKQMSLENYASIFQSPNLLHSLEHSLIVAVSTGILVTAICSVVAYITVKTTARGRSLLEGVATAPIAIPSIIMGVSILYWYLVAPIPIHLYGTLAILVIAMVTNCMPYGMRYMVPGVSQIKSELEEASLVSGANWLTTFRRVYIPLLVPAITASFLYAFIISFREISSALFLYTQRTEVISISVFELWSDGQFTIVSALGIAMTLIVGVAIAIVGILSRKFGFRAR